MSQLETAMAILMTTFDTYAGADGKPDTLSKKEVKALLEKELPGLLAVSLRHHCKPVVRREHIRVVKL